MWSLTGGLLISNHKFEINRVLRRFLLILSRKLRVNKVLERQREVLIDLKP